MLERLYSLAEGVRARIRRIPQADLVEGAIVDGEVVFEATLADQIDNMEGLSIWRRDDGATVFSLLSDDNRRSCSGRSIWNSRWFRSADRRRGSRGRGCAEPDPRRAVSEPRSERRAGSRSSAGHRAAARARRPAS